MNGIQKNNPLLWGFVGTVVALAIWSWAALVTGPEGALYSPWAAAAAAWNARSLFLSQALASLAVALAGLLVALLVAFATASASALSARAHAAVTPLVLAQQTVPLVAIAPLMAQLIGEGWIANVLIVAWLCWFPAVIAFTQGLLTVDPDRLAIFKVAEATRWQTFVGLQLPGAAESLVTGIRASAGFALIGAIVAEYGAADLGLGGLVMKHVRGVAPLPPDAVMGLVLVCAASGLALTIVATGAARWLLRGWLPINGPK